jgi:hypothetical protein
VVVPVSVAPVSLGFQVTAGQCEVSWPTDHIGWHLQTQSHPNGGGLTTNWTDVANSTLTNRVTIPMSHTNDVFFRLVYP